MLCLSQVTFFSHRHFYQISFKTHSKNHHLANARIHLFKKNKTQFSWYFYFITKSLSNLTEYLPSYANILYKVTHSKMTLPYDVKCKTISKAIINKSISSLKALRPLLSAGLLNFLWRTSKTSKILEFLCSSHCSILLFLISS